MAIITYDYAYKTGYNDAQTGKPCNPSFLVEDMAEAYENGYNDGLQDLCGEQGN